jgi:dihydroorotate dehydrogenase
MPVRCNVYLRPNAFYTVYRLLLRRLFFLFPAETAHHLAMGMLSALTQWWPLAKIVAAMYMPRHRETTTVFGLNFRNWLGLAAGFDKDGRHLRALASLGFGFIEVGTVTPRPQTGNPRPRLFRLSTSKALINRMGFNNAGCDKLAERLQGFKDREVVLGANIGKNKDTPNDRATEDYLYCFGKLHPYVDYFVVNVSSPNTPNLRQLQEKGPLKAILSAIQERNRQLPEPRPILLKIAPDLTDGQLGDIVEIALETRLAGIVATNTTILRQGLAEPVRRIESMGAGGLSGRPVHQRAVEVIRYVHARSAGKLQIIGVGGVFTREDAEEMLAAGASLVQVYTGFIYQGPGIVKSIVGR